VGVGVGELGGGHLVGHQAVEVDELDDEVDVLVEELLLVGALVPPAD